MAAAPRELFSRTDGGVDDRRGEVVFLPLPEAALRLGVSQSALRRRLRAGTAQGERRPSPGGFTWWVGVDEPAPTPTPIPPPTPRVSADEPGVGAPTPPPTPELSAALEAVQRLEAHVASLTDEVEARRREVGQLHTLLAQTNQRLLADGLSRNGQVSEPTRPPETHDAPQAEPWPEARRWWQRLLWG